jgi:predicted P-loop ATPase
MSFLHHHQSVEAITDPASQQLSMSRFLIGVIVLVYWPMNCVMDFILKLLHIGKMENWLALGTMTGAIAGIYWFNSTAGAWQRGGQPGPIAKANPAPPEKAD